MKPIPFLTSLAGSCRLGRVLGFWLLAGLAGGAARVEAASLNWNDSGVDWPSSGALSGTFSDVGGSGVGVTITFSGSTGELQNGPIDNSTLNGGTPGNQSLYVEVDYDNRNPSVTVTVEFSEAVLNPSFSLFDVDRLTIFGSPLYEDEIAFISGSLNGNSVAATLTSGAANTVVTTNGTQVLRGTADSASGSADGNASIAFNGRIDQFTFTYTNGPSTLGLFGSGNPSVQFVGMFGDITFTPIPEYHEGLAGLLLCSLVILRHRRKNVPA